MKEYEVQENVIEIAMHEKTDSSGIDFDVYLNGKFIDGGILVNAKTIPDVLEFVGGMMKNQSRYQMRNKPMEIKK